jgi:hypothetical protein
VARLQLGDELEDLLLPVTSSAVVGSSATISLGSAAKPRR